jgi:alcohol dehydrogenase (cytochrome c)
MRFKFLHGRRLVLAVGASCIALAAAAGGAYAALSDSGTPPPEVAANAATGWPEHSYNLQNTRNDDLTSISAANVMTLKPQWTFPLPDVGEFGAYTTNAIVLNGVIYFENPDANVYAVQEATGELLWSHLYNSAIPSGGPEGLAVGYGRLYGATESQAFALDLQTGKQVWTSRPLIANKQSGIDMAPQVADGRVYISTIPGSSTSFYAPGARGTLYALNAATGSTIWSWSTVKGGAKLWGDPKVNSGGGLWYPPAIDSQGRVFAGVANPAPLYGTPTDPNNKDRPGADLYSSSIAALDGATGKLLWYYQVTPHDIRDYDCQVSPMVIGSGSSEEVIGGCKSGKVVALDANTGKRLWEDNVGEHIHDIGPLPKKTELVCPGTFGGVESPMAAQGGVVYVPYMNLCAHASATGSTLGAGGKSISFNGTGGVSAINATTGKIMWTAHFPSIDVGAATVANNVVFTSTINGKIYALSTTTGKTLWSTVAPGGINGFPAITKDSLIIGTGAPSSLTFGTLQRGVVTTPHDKLIAYTLGG